MFFFFFLFFFFSSNSLQSMESYRINFKYRLEDHLKFDTISLKSLAEAVKKLIPMRNLES